MLENKMKHLDLQNDDKDDNSLPEEAAASFVEVLDVAFNQK